MLEGAAFVGATLAGAAAGFVVFFTFLTFLVVAGAVAVWPVLLSPAGVEAGAWAAKVRGMAATANPIANSVFFMVPFFSLAGFYCPLTISCCGRPAGNSIACAGYWRRPIKGSHG